MTWTQLFPFVSTKEKGPEKGNVITFSLRMPCKQLLCSARGAPDDSNPPRNHREWYKETFNFAYNLENGFSEQTLLSFFSVGGARRESDSWEIMGRGGCNDSAKQTWSARYWLMQILCPSKITLASPHAMKMDSFFGGVFFWLLLVLYDKKRNKRSTTRRDFCNNNEILKSLVERAEWES